MLSRITARHIAGAVLAVLILPLIAEWSSSSAKEPADAAAKTGAASVRQPQRTGLSPRADASPEDKQAIRDLLRMRSEQGDPFQGTVFEELASPDSSQVDGSQSRAAWSQQEFARALEKVIREKSASLPTPTTVRPYNTGATRPSGTGPSASHADRKLAGVLRRASRLLCRKANKLEGLRAFEEADRLRELASQIRAESRRWIPPPPSQ